MIKKSVLLVAAGLMTTVIMASSASAQSCYDLWYARNAIFDAYGFCFRTSLGRRVFDNSDCYTRNPRLSSQDARRVANIRRRERRRGCRVNR